MEAKVQVLDAPAPSHRWTWQAVVSMVLLIAQSTALSIMLRLSRVKSGTPYLASVSVVLTEGLKLALCTGAVLASAHSRRQHLGTALASTLRNGLPMAVPACCFVMQQLLLVYAASRLDAVSFQVFNQSFKLVPTAALAWLLLGQRLRPAQWASIPALAAGVVLVTLTRGAADATPAGRPPGAARAEWVAGSLACAASGLSSAYAGVHFEKHLKGGRGAALTVRNVQLGAFGLPLSLAVAAARDGRALAARGPLTGFDAATWSVVGLQVFGGLAMGAVVKHCDNIIKNFALAASVVLTVALAIPLFGQWPSSWFLLGVGLILLSVSLYSGVLDTPSQGTMLASLAQNLGWMTQGLGKNAPTRRRRLVLLGIMAAALCGAGLYRNLTVTPSVSPIRLQRQQFLAQIASLVAPNATNAMLG
ncbi:hypothetical protein ACKKBG_A24760 [Auxenochlorella protothecoides x Auxenochlorella symbiontica]